MVLEATMICIDNSEWMRNGDYTPSRFQAQADAVNLICGAKTQTNPENTVGILTMAGRGVRVLATPTSDLGKILGCMHGLEMGGEINIAAALQVAQLALKHRQNKHQQQRIIVFAGSPVNFDKKVLETIGKKLKKNSVALDIIDFGEEDDGKPEKLEALLAAVNNNGHSHMVHVSPGPNALSDVLLSSPVFTGDGEGGSDFAVAAAAGSASGFDFGVDPNLDPELALALRVSLEEERARQEAAARRAAGEASRQEKEEEPLSNTEEATTAEHVDIADPEENNNASDEMDDENPEEAQAMSIDISGSDLSVGDAEMTLEITEDRELILALEMSMQGGEEDHQSAAESLVSKVLKNQAAVSSILASLPGVDPDDPSVQEILASLRSHFDKKNEDDPPSEDD